MILGNDFIGFYAQEKNIEGGCFYCLTLYPFTFTVYNDTIQGKAIEFGIFKLYFTVRIGTI